MHLGNMVLLLQVYYICMCMYTQQDSISAATLYSWSSLPSPSTYLSCLSLLLSFPLSFPLSSLSLSLSLSPSLPPSLPPSPPSLSLSSEITNRRPTLVRGRSSLVTPTPPSSTSSRGYQTPPNAPDTKLSTLKRFPDPTNPPH